MGTVKAAQAVAKDARSAFSTAAAAKKAANPPKPRAAKSKAAPKAPNGGAWTRLFKFDPDTMSAIRSAICNQIYVDVGAWLRRIGKPRGKDQKQQGC